MDEESGALLSPTPVVFLWGSPQSPPPKGDVAPLESPQKPFSFAYFHTDDKPTQVIGRRLVYLQGGSSILFHRGHPEKDAY